MVTLVIAFGSLGFHDFLPANFTFHFFFFFKALIAAPFFLPLLSSFEGLLHHLTLACRTPLSGPSRAPTSRREFGHHKCLGQMWLGSGGYVC